MTVTEHKTIKILPSVSGEHCLFFKIGHSQKSICDIFGCQCPKDREQYVLLN